MTSACLRRGRFKYPPGAGTERWSDSIRDVRRSVRFRDAAGPRMDGDNGRQAERPVLHAMGIRRDVVWPKAAGPLRMRFVRNADKLLPTQPSRPVVAILCAQAYPAEIEVLQPAQRGRYGPVTRAPVSPLNHLLTTSSFPGAHTFKG
jgi:hypothetical protein